MTKSAIEWTQATWNPIVGCSIVSPGCTHCYAMAMASRIEAMNAVLPRRQAHAPQYDGTTKKVNGKPVWTGKLQLAEAKLLDPLRRKTPTTWFVNSMGDLFHEDCPDAWIDKVFAVMALTPHHTYQVLTKRATRMRAYCLNARVRAPGFVEHACGIAQRIPGLDTSSMRYLDIVSKVGAVYPLPNVWLGVSTERQQEADERIPELLQTPAAVRFISAEPLLGPIDLTKVRYGKPEHGHLSTVLGRGACPSQQDAHGYHTFLVPDGLDWVIVGGESGPNARPMHPDWARSLRDQCTAAGVPFFFKQWGEWRPPAAGEFYNTLRGRAGTPPAFIMEANGNVHCTGFTAGMDAAKPVIRVGKKVAGRALDGLIHDEYPEAAR